MVDYSVSLYSQQKHPLISRIKSFNDESYPLKGRSHFHVFRIILPSRLFSGTHHNFWTARASNCSCNFQRYIIHVVHFRFNSQKINTNKNISFHTRKDEPGTLILVKYVVPFSRAVSIDCGISSVNGVTFSASW